MKNLSILGMTLLMLLAACSRDPVETVKQGTLPYGTSDKIGDVFSRYLYIRSPAWTCFPDNQKRTIVEFKGSLAIDQYRGKSYRNRTLDEEAFEAIRASVTGGYCSIQFAFSKDDETFALHYCGIELHMAGGLRKYYTGTSQSIIACIYKDQPDETTMAALLGIAAAEEHARARERSKKAAEEAATEAFSALDAEAAEKAPALWAGVMQPCGEYSFWIDTETNLIYQGHGKPSVEVWGGAIPGSQPGADAEPAGGAASKIEWEGFTGITFEHNRKMSNRTWGPVESDTQKTARIVKKDGQWSIEPEGGIAPYDCTQLFPH